jgi:nucleoside-diphosphate-sugar epimerase
VSHLTDRVAVTGATGFIGWHVCERLRDAGWQVVAVARPGSRKPLPPGVERVAANLDTGALLRVCGRATAIVHAAGITRARSTAEYRLVNVEGTRAVAEAARALDARMVHVSSLTAAGPAPSDRPKTEADASSPITAYGRSKLDSEGLVIGTPGLRWTTIRPAAVYGPRDRQFLPLFQAARRGLIPRPWNADVFALTLVHVEDVARAIEMACGRDAADRQTLFIGHPAVVSLDSLLRTVALTLNHTYRPVPVPFALVRLSAWLGVGGMSAERFREMTSPGFVCSVERADRCLGFRAAVDLADGFRSTADWYFANRWLS